MLTPVREDGTEESWLPMRYADQVRRRLAAGEAGLTLLGPPDPIHFDSLATELAAYRTRIGPQTAVYLDGHGSRTRPYWFSGCDRVDGTVCGGSFYPAKFDRSHAVAPGLLVIGSCYAGRAREEWANLVVPGTPVVASRRLTYGADANRLVWKYVLRPFAHGEFEPDAFWDRLPKYQQGGWDCVRAA